MKKITFWEYCEEMSTVHQGSQLEISTFILFFIIYYKMVYDDILINKNSAS